MIYIVTNTSSFCKHCYGNMTTCIQFCSFTWSELFFWQTCHFGTVLSWLMDSPKFNFAKHLFPFNLLSSFCLTHLVCSPDLSLTFTYLSVSEFLYVSTLIFLSFDTSLQGWLSPPEHPSADHLLPVWGGWVSTLARCQPSAVPTRQATGPHQGLQHL